MDFNFLLMVVEETAELTDKQIMGSTVIALLMFFSYPIWLIIKWFRQGELMLWLTMEINFVCGAESTSEII